MALKHLNDDDKGVPNGVASLDGSGEIPLSQIPSIPPNVEQYYIENDSSSTNVTTAFVERISLGFTPTAGDYIVMGSYDLGNTEKKKSEARVQIDNVPDLQLVQNKVENNNTYQSESFMVRKTFTNAPHTVDIDFRKAEGAGTAAITNTRILVYRIS